MKIKRYVGDLEKQTSFFKPTTLVKVRRTNTYGTRSRAVFATKNIAAGTSIERCPMIRMPQREVFPPLNEWPTISHYCFDWHDENGEPFTALALGYGSLYNHSVTSNACFRYKNSDCLEIVAVRDIKKGEEVTINYNGDPTDRSTWEFEKSGCTQ